MKCFVYQKCSTCRDAIKWLQAHGIAAEMIDIRSNPPSVSELHYAWEKRGDVKLLLNTSGAEYRAMGLKDRINTMAVDELFALIQEHGNLCKRPFLIDPSLGIALTGFQPEVWESTLL